MPSFLLFTEENKKHKKESMAYFLFPTNSVQGNQSDIFTSDKFMTFRFRRENSLVNWSKSEFIISKKGIIFLSDKFAFHFF